MSFRITGLDKIKGVRPTEETILNEAGRQAERGSTEAGRNIQELTGMGQGWVDSEKYAL